MPNSKHLQHKKAGVRRQRSDLQAAPSLPAITKPTAIDFVRLMHAGLPAAKALAYIHPELDEKACRELAKTWGQSPLALDATIAYTKGEWHTLDPDARLQLARDKWLAEQAYFLYTHQFSTLDGEDLAKAKYAHAQISIYLTLTGSSEKDPVREFYKDLDKQIARESSESPDAETSH